MLDLFLSHPYNINPIDTRTRNGTNQFSDSDEHTRDEANAGNGQSTTGSTGYLIENRAAPSIRGFEARD